MSEYLHKHMGSLLFLLCLLLYSLSMYGGARSPDSEAVLYAAESLLQNGTLGAPEHPILRNAGFAKGIDGLYYPVFGPALSVVYAPMLTVGRTLAQVVPNVVVNSAPVNIYLTNGFDARYGRAPLENPRSHWVRLPAAWLNAVFAALAVLIFWKALLWLGGDRRSVAFAVGLLAFSGPLWPYAETMFSEPLALTATLASFAAIARLNGFGENMPRPFVWALGSGLALGLATITHLSAILFAPFFAVWLLVQKTPKRLLSFLCWVIGFCTFLLVLGILNDARFGNVLETGRTVDAEAMRLYGYGKFIAPWKGLYNLLFSSAKGMVWYAPTLLAGLLLLPKIGKRFKVVTVILWAAVVFRLVFMAMRSDWHGGFSPGPRYLMMAYPFLLLPVAFVSWRNLSRSMLLTVLVLAVLGIGVQALLVSGDIFVFFFMAKDYLVQLGVSLNQIFEGATLYTDWRVAPLLNIHVAPVAPLLARLCGLGFWTTWMLLFGLAGAMFFLWVRVASGIGMENPNENSSASEK